jgi:hypothetical protein
MGIRGRIQADYSTQVLMGSALTYGFAAAKPLFRFRAARLALLARRPSGTGTSCFLRSPIEYRLLMDRKALL